MKMFLLMVLTALLAACESTRESNESNQRLAARLMAEQKVTQERLRLRPFDIAVESEPAGAVIEVNEDMRGRAPCTIKVEARGDRTAARMVTIKAIPVRPGESVQLKFIMTDDKLPERIFFNMHLQRPPSTIDVNVN